MLLEADDNQRKVWQQIVDAFHQAGHKPSVELSNPSSIYTKFDTMVAGNAGPDLFAGFETKQLPHYAGVGAALNMDPYVARSTTIKPASFFAYTWSKHVLNGHLYAMPTNNAMLAIFYNVDLFKEAGVAPPAGVRQGPRARTPGWLLRRKRTGFPETAGSLLQGMLVSRADGDASVGILLFPLRLQCPGQHSSRRW